MTATATANVNIARALAIDGWMPEPELRWLAQLAQSARTIIEIGSWKGRSTRALADNAAAAVPGAQGAVYAVDHWQGQLFDPTAGPSVEIARHGSDAVFGEFLRNVGDLINANRLAVMRMPSSAAANRLAERAVVADMVFIDGDHQYDGCKADVLAYRRLLRPGGLLCGHDYNGLPRHAGVQRSVDELYPHRNLHYSIWWVRV
jgi:SAM-dependent methyltransferase